LCQDHTYNYTLRQRRSDETLRGSEKHRVFVQAVVEGQLPRVRNFLRMGVDLDDTGTSDLTVLHRAVLSGHEDVIEPLIEAGADVNATSDEFGTPLCLAALKGMHQAVSLLLKYKARPRTITQKTGTALHCCMFSVGDCRATLLALLSAGARLATHATIDTQWLQAICEWNGDDRNEVASPSRADARILNQVTAAFIAAQTGRSDLLELLLPPDLDHAFQVASQRTRGGPPRLISPFQTYVTICAKNGDIGGLQLLIAKGAKLDIDNDTAVPPLVTAAEEGHKNVVMLLLDGGASINARDCEGSTALVNAARASFHGVVRVLCARGATVDTKNRFGFTALHYAVIEGRHQVINVLCEFGAKVDVESSDRITPLWYAVRDPAHQGDKSCCGEKWHSFQMLIDAGADILAMLNLISDIDPVILRKFVLAGADMSMRAEDGTSVLKSLLGRSPRCTEPISESIFRAMQFDEAILSRSCVRLVSICQSYDGWQRESTLIYESAKAGREDLEIILAIGADLHAKGCKGVQDATALHRAARVGSCVAIDHLLMTSAPLKLYDHKGQTPLAIAVRY
jgi:ankyrin repeat protein